MDGLLFWLLLIGGIVIFAVIYEVRRPSVSNTATRMMTGEQMHCKRPDGTDRAWFNSREEAEAFAQDPVNTAYQSDVIVFCGRCGFYHCSNPNWNVSRPWEIPVENLAVN